MSQTQVANLVRITTQEISPAKLQLPSPVITAFTVFQKIHRLWRLFRAGDLYTNPDNFFKLAAGHSLNALTDSKLLRVAAIGLLIATRILECIEQQTKVQRAWDKLVCSIKGEFFPSVKCRWEVKPGSGFFSTSTFTWFKSLEKTLLLRIERIAISIFQVGKQLFILSMRIMDTIESFSLSPSTSNEGINELFINGAKWMDKLEENKDVLIEGLINNKEIIDKVLKGIPSPLTTDQLIETTQKALGQAVKIHQGAEGVCHSIGVFTVAWLQKLGHELLYNVGLHNLVPTPYVPPPVPPGETEPLHELTEYYPPDELITRPSMLPQKPVEITPVQINEKKSFSDFSSLLNKYSKIIPTLENQRPSIFTSKIDQFGH